MTCKALIKNIIDSFHRHLSNFTFEASLAFQMKEDYVYLFILYCALIGGVRNFTHKLRMFLDSFELGIKEKNKIKKTILKMWSQISGKIVMLVHKVTLKQKCKKK